MTTPNATLRLSNLKNQGLPYVLLLATMFGTSLISSRFVLRELSSITFIGMRMTVAVVCFIILFTFSKSFEFPRDPKVWKHGAVLGIIGTTIPMTAFISSLNYLSSGVAAIIGTIGPALTVVLAHFLLKDDKLTLQKGVGVLIALSGAILLSVRGETGLGDAVEFNPIGYLLILCSTVKFGVRRHLCPSIRARIRRSAGHKRACAGRHSHHTASRFPPLRCRSFRVKQRYVDRILLQLDCQFIRGLHSGSLHCQ